MQRIKEYKKKARSLGLLSVNVLLSITTTLFIFGLCGLLILHANKLGKLIRENLEIQVFLEKNLTDSTLQEVKKKLLRQKYVKHTHDNTLTFISKEKAKQDFIATTGEDFSEILDDNPLRDAFLIKVKEAFYTSEKMKIIQKELEKIDGVYETSYVEDFLKTINQNIAAISSFLFLFGLFILVTVIILIDNTIKISLFSQRLLIRSMQLVGATDRFIQKPFLIRALTQGSLSGLIAAILLFLFLNYLQTQIEELIVLYEPENMLLLAMSLIVLGSLIAWGSAYRAVNKYLKMSLDDLY